MAFVHGHARDAGWVMSHYRRPQVSGDAQLDLDLPAPRAPADVAEAGGVGRSGAGSTEDTASVDAAEASD